MGTDEPGLSEMKKCKYCGREIGKDTNFCWYCGRELEARPEHPMPVETGGRSSRILLIGAALIVVALLIWALIAPLLR